MKPTELMVGDWVYAIDDNGEKHPCRANHLEYDYTNKRGDFCVDFYGTGYDAEWPDVAFNVEPIHLTPEILEKNGFVKCIGGRSKKSLQITGDGLYVSWWNDRLVIRYKRVLGHPSAYLNCDCRYVHELQHALHMAGIEKEIVI